MPSYLDFDNTKSFRNFILGKTLQSPEGPQNSSQSTYTYQNLSNLSNTDPGSVDSNRQDDLNKGLFGNTYKPTEQVTIYDELQVIPRINNLRLYSDNSGNPYFNYTNHTMIGIIGGNDKYENESELFKFAAYNIKNNSRGPFFARIQQNLEAATVGRFRLLDALTGNIATATNIVSGREPLIESNNRITVAKTAPGKAIDLIERITGVDIPMSQIPGDYLTNPLNPINYRPVPDSTAGAIGQDMTGALGSLIGIQRRPLPTRKPSDLFIEYMGSGPKQKLFNLLSLSTYAPDYTTTARSQQSSKIFSFADQFAQGIKTLLDTEAPKGKSYIGDDRGVDVIDVMTDSNGIVIRSNYYLSLLFDPIQSQLFERRSNISEGGQISGKLTWVGQNSKNKLGANNDQYSSQSSKLQDSLSTKYGFREDSLLGYTQAILNAMPKDGQARTHIGNVIDQTSRVFKEGESFLSRGSAVKYVDKFGVESGVEYCRTWTKDRPYFSLSDTMKKGMNLRKFESSVMSNPWNLNIGPMSNGNKGFGNSTNISDKDYKFGVDSSGNSFYAKKYMFSIENLAWRTSSTPGFTVLDLPFCERGPNGGRVMWFPPYDLKVNESNSAKWEENTFLGRPEPIYTYQNTSRSGQISFKVVVDHPSILNLLVREYFKNMSDEEADNYINAFFAGCEELDFYDLIRRFTTIDASDAELITQYLNAGKKTEEEIKKYKTLVQPVTDNNPGNNDKVSVIPNENSNTSSQKNISVRLNYDDPQPNGFKDDTTSVTSNLDYSKLYNSYITKKDSYKNELGSIIPNLLTDITSSGIQDLKTYFYGAIPSDDLVIGDIVNYQKQKLGDYFDTLSIQYNKFTGITNTLLNDLSGKTVQTITLEIDSGTSSIASPDLNRKLSLRRSHSVIRDMFTKISNGKTPTIKWKTLEEVNALDKNSPIEINQEYDLKDFGWEINGGKLIVKSKNYGEDSTGTGVDTDCKNRDFKKYTRLNVVSPISFYCRVSQVRLSYNTTSETISPVPTSLPENNSLKTTIVEDGKFTIEKIAKKPPIDVMKRIIMKTLSECYYFKVLENDSPIVFDSLREKLRYFHPGFHSTTPEGLNSRLTFLQQCIRPGDTIPIKGDNKSSDINASNSTFGPPPICVLRIGDFYHSKVVIRDVNFTFDETTWDLNPEGIGVQPMIANVSLQVSFIGGQGLEKPVERLQNALSSNFYANTEMYDERSESTNTKINGKDATVFTKEILENFNKSAIKEPDYIKGDNSSKISEENYIGTLSNSTLDYTNQINEIYTEVNNYFEKYDSVFNTLYKSYGLKIASLLLSPTYRTINQYDVYTSTSMSPGDTINIFGLYGKGKELPVLIRGIRIAMDNQLELEYKNVNLPKIFNFDKELSNKKLPRTNELLYREIKKILQEIFDRLSELNSLTYFEENRNKLIKSIDSLNFVVKYGKDGKLGKDNTKSTSALLSGFTYNLLYNEYSDCFDNIKNNTPKMYDKLDESINFINLNINPTIDTNTFSEILSYFLIDNFNRIMALFYNEYDEKTNEKLNNRLKDFIAKPKTINLKFKNLRNRKNGKTIKFPISVEENITDNTMLDDLKKLNTTPTLVKEKLNFYKIK
jgi:hypothetical protein